MIQRWSVVVAFITFVVLRAACASAHAGGATRMRGQLSLTFSVDDRGVSYYSSSIHDLRLELTMPRDGRASMRVRGRVRRQEVFISPASRSSPIRSEAGVDDRWVGRATRAHGGIELKLALVTRARVRDPIKLELACTRTMEPLAGAARPGRVALLRCAPLTPYTDHPWNDLHPRYARVPLVFAARGDVLLLVTADHGHASVGAPRAVHP